MSWWRKLELDGLGGEGAIDGGGGCRPAVTRWLVMMIMTTNTSSAIFRTVPCVIFQLSWALQPHTLSLILGVV